MTDKTPDTFAEKAKRPSGVTTRDLIVVSMSMALVTLLGAKFVPPAMIERFPWVQYPLFAMAAGFVLIAVTAPFVSVTPAEDDTTGD